MKEEMKIVKNAISSYIENGELQKAESLVNELAEIVGNNDEVLSIKAIIEFIKGNYEKSINYIQLGLKVNIANSDLYFNMGKVLEAKEEKERALLCYKQALYYCRDQYTKKYIIDSIKDLEKSTKVANTSIIILTYNKLEYTKLCINSIRGLVDNATCEIIVIDNNSKDDTKEWLKEQKDLKCIFNSENKGFPGGCNQGILAAQEGNDIFLLNNDTILMPNSLFNLKMGLYKNKDTGAVGAVSNSVSYYQQVNINVDNEDDYYNFAINNNITNDASYEERMKLVGFAMLIKGEVVDKVGLLDERFTPGNYEDDDYSVRIIEQGYKLVLCKDSYIHHFGSVSFKENSVFADVLRKNSKKFKEKWGFSSEYSYGIRFDIIDKIQFPIDKKINVLEIGCAGGATLLKIKDIFKNANVYGVDIDENVTKISSKVLNTQVINIEKEDLPFPKKYFDVIILPDVLEHLINPWDTLKKVKEYLDDNGQLIASIPNIMHISVIEELLSGRFEYTNSGILDITHMRFFTLDSINKMFKDAKFKEIDIDNNMISITQEQKEKIQKMARVYGVDEKQYETYQYIISAKPNSRKMETLEIEMITSSDKNSFISFIACVNDETYFKRCRERILKVNIPEGYGIEIIKVKNAKSITSAYNKAMKLAKGKYKFYLHQDIEILNTSIIEDVIEIFKDKKIGMIGIAGSKCMPENGVWWQDKLLLGRVFERRSNNISLLELGDISDKYEEAKIIDGCLMITQYDISWDEENFGGWHFYDVTQCFRFWQNDKSVVIPRQDDPWAFHDCGEVSLEGFEEYRKKFLELYRNN